MFTHPVQDGPESPPRAYDTLENLRGRAVQYIDGIQRSLLYRQSRMTNKNDKSTPYIGLRSDKEVTFRKVRMRIYETYYKSPMWRYISICEMLKPEHQSAITKVKFKQMTKIICRNISALVLMMHNYIDSELNCSSSHNSQVLCLYFISLHINLLEEHV